MNEITTYHKRLEDKKSGKQNRTKLEEVFTVLLLTREDVIEALLQNDVPALRARQIALSLTSREMRELAEKMSEQCNIMEIFWDNVRDYVSERQNERGE